MSAAYRSDDSGKSWRRVAGYATSPQHLRGLALLQWRRQDTRPAAEYVSLAKDARAQADEKLVQLLELLAESTCTP
jgi:hypothetical protein